MTGSGHQVKKRYRPNFNYPYALVSHTIFGRLLPYFHDVFSSPSCITYTCVCRCRCPVAEFMTVYDIVPMSENVQITPIPKMLDRSALLHNLCFTTSICNSLLLFVWLVVWYTYPRARSLIT